jgi:hypothetical protein
LKCADIKGENESIIVAVQDQALGTSCFKGKKVLKEETESKWRMCKAYKATTDHLTSGCSILVLNFILRMGLNNEHKIILIM